MVAGRSLDLGGKRRGAESAVFVCAVVLGAAGLEIALRIAYRHSLDFSMEMWKYAVALKRPVADPNLGFVHAPNTSAFLMGADMRISSQGLRDRAYPREQPAGVDRVQMPVGVTTVCWG